MSTSETGAQAEARESVFYEDAGVRVTNRRFVSGTTAYAIANLTSVSLVRAPKQTALPLAGALFGATLLLAARTLGQTLFAWAWLVVFAMIFVRRLRTRHQVRIGTTGGETLTLSMENENRAGRIASALNRAIASG